MTNNVNVSSANTLSQIGITTPQNYYDGLSKQWAIGEGLVQNVDYSSKTYAQQSKESALNASLSENNAKTSEETAQSIITLGQEAIEEQKNNYISELETKTQDSLLSIDSKTKEELNNIDNLAKSYNTLTQRQITNCLTEIPQNIKLDLTDGVLTLKAGSVAIVPYGVEDLTAQYPIGSTFIHENFKVYDTQFSDGKFFVWVELVNDLSPVAIGGGSRALMLMYDGTISTSNINFLWSGDTPSDDTSKSRWYDTTTNLIKERSNNIWNTNTYLSFPIMIGTAVSELFTSIDEVFNGMGYIGSTIWVDKGVKGLIPNGRNEDGSLKNIEFVCNKLSTRTFNDTVNMAIIFINDEGIARLSNTTYRYDADTNYNRNVDVNWQALFIATLTTTSGIISDFQPKQPFRAIDYSDKSEVSGFAMPSDRYIDLTLGASSTTYTAPANGWFALTKQASASGQYIQFRSDVTNFICKAISVGTKDVLCVFFPAKKRQALKAEYSAQGATSYFRFIYAEGEV